MPPCGLPFASLLDCPSPPRPSTVKAGTLLRTILFHSLFLFYIWTVNTATMVNQTESNYNATQNNQNLSPGDPPLEKDFSNNGKQRVTERSSRTTRVLLTGSVSYRSD